ALRAGKRKALQNWLLLTVVLGVIFLGLQLAEYAHAYRDLGLTLKSGIYGSTFFMLTGFHGFHVTMGAIILTVMLIRVYKGHFTPSNHFGFEAAAWYCHFVYVVCVALFIFVYALCPISLTSAAMGRPTAAAMTRTHRRSAELPPR